MMIYSKKSKTLEKSIIKIYSFKIMIIINQLLLGIYKVTLKVAFLFNCQLEQIGK